MEETNQTPSNQEKTEAEKNVPVRYIRQPYPISAMQADLSRQQIRILVGMMQSVQDGVQEMFERGPVNNQLLLFPDITTDRIPIDFKFSDVADRADAYRDVEKIANKFMQMVFRYEDKQKGEVTLAHFVDSITYPRKGSKRDKIRFYFTREQAQAVFDFTMYSRYMLSVASEAESKHTARIYMLITSARGFDHDGTGVFHWYIGYEELRRMLGCDEKDEHGHWFRKSQKLYKHFKSDVLRTAEREMKQLADNGKCDCWFEFVELPEDFVGEPQRFDFVVHLSEMGRQESSRIRNHEEAMKLVKYMEETFALTERQAIALIEPIDLSRLDAFNKEVQDYAAKAEKRTDINNKARYAEVSIAAIAEHYKPGVTISSTQPKNDTIVTPSTNDYDDMPEWGE